MTGPLAARTICRRKIIQKRTGTETAPHESERIRKGVVLI